MQNALPKIPKVQISHTIKVADVLAVYKSFEMRFTYICFAIAHILQQRDAFKLPVYDDDRRSCYIKFRSSYDYLQDQYPMQLSEQINGQLHRMLSSIGYKLYDMQEMQNPEYFGLSAVRTWEMFTGHDHDYRVHILTAILEKDREASFMVSLG